MEHTLKTKKCQEFSSRQIVEEIKKYLEEQKANRQKDNLDDEDFMSPSWAHKQAYNNGAIKMCNKFLNFLPKE